MFEKDTLNILTTLAGILFLVAFVPYIRAIWRDRKKPRGEKGKAGPAKASWIIWATLDTVTLAGMYTAGTLNGQIVGAVSGAWVVAFLALRYGTPGWTKLDKLCLSGAVVGLVVWYWSGNPTLGIVISNTSVFVGAFPTFASAWRDPSREDKVAWTIYWLSCVLAVLAIPARTLADMTQPLTFFVIESTVMYLLFVQPRISKAYHESYWGDLFGQNHEYP